MNKKDTLILAIIMLVYSLFAFVNLGDTKSPESYWENSAESFVIVDLGTQTDVGYVNLYNGKTPSRGERYDISISADGETFESVEAFDLDRVFAWHKINIGKKVRYLALGITAKKGFGYIGEIAPFSPGGEKLKIKSVINQLGQQEFKLFDEQALAPSMPSFKNGTYFDEIYHARTAYEYINGTEAYEWTHPPLGKLIIAVGIKVFGMTPFGWRFMGTFVGLLMLPVMYMLAKKLFKNTFFAAVATALLSADFMHFTQSRIATIDVYATFFVMMMYLFMHGFYVNNYNETGLKKPLTYLAFAGISFGLGAATKWSCIYAGAGLFAVFVIYMLKRFVEYRKNSAEGYIKNTLKIIFWCVAFFVVVPIGIYLLSYLPYAFVGDGEFTLSNIFRIQNNMFDYHSTLEASHPYSSPWYSWPLVKRPIWYHITYLENSKVMSISAFGNPAVWWAGIPATFIAIAVAIKNKDEIPMLLIIGYASQYLPWALIGRIVFIYHYFPSVPFVVLIITYVLKTFYEGLKNEKCKANFKKGILVYIGVCAFLFILFYPAISGAEINKSYITNLLTWFESWNIGG